MENWSASCSTRPSVYWHVCYSHSDNNNYFNTHIRLKLFNLRRMRWILHWWGRIMKQLRRFFNVLSEIGPRKIFSLWARRIFDTPALEEKMVATDVLILRWSHFQLSVTPSDRNRRKSTWNGSVSETGCVLLSSTWGFRCFTRYLARL